VHRQLDCISRGLDVGTGRVPPAVLVAEIRGMLVRKVSVQYTLDAYPTRTLAPSGYGFGRMRADTDTPGDAAPIAAP